MSMILCTWQLLCTREHSTLEVGEVTFCLCFLLWKIFMDPFLGVKYLMHLIASFLLARDEGRINRLFPKAIKNATWYWTFPENLMKTHRAFQTSLPFWTQRELWKPAEVRGHDGIIEYLFKKKKRLSNYLFGEFCEMLEKIPSLPKIETCTLLKNICQKESKCWKFPSWRSG